MKSKFSHYPHKASSRGNHAREPNNVNQNELYVFRIIKYLKISDIDELMSEIDLKPLHPKNKILLYSRYVLSKLSWHFTVATISKTWVVENIDSPVNKHIRKWLEVPISGTLSNVFLTRNKFGLNILPASVKFIQCQTVLRNALKTSPNDSINYELWKSTNNHTNI